MDTPEAQIAQLIKQLGSRNEITRQKAMDSLVDIGSPAVLPLIDLIIDKNRCTINMSIKGTTTTFKVDGPASRTPHGRAWDILVKIGVVALPSLVRNLTHDLPFVRFTMCLIIKAIGDENTLSRRIVVDCRLSPKEKYDTLELLRNTRYKETQYHLQLQFNWLPAQQMCARLIQDKDPDISAAAADILKYCTLLRPSIDSSAQSQAQELLRSMDKQPQDAKTEELLRSSSPELPASSPVKQQNNFLQRWGRRRMSS